jgi:uncharacterized membrane protein YraQ (UPF0718 family)
MASGSVVPLFRRFHEKGMTLDATMLTAIGVLFTTVTGAIGWLVGKLWAERSELQGKFVTMLEKQYDATGNRKDLFDNLGKTVDGLAQAVKDLTREVQGQRTDIQKIRP